MKIRMLVSVAGLARPEYRLNRTFSFAAGDELDADDELAALWIKSGHAERIDEEKKPSRRAKAEKDDE